MLIGGPHVRPSSVDRLTNTVGELMSGSSGSDEISQTRWAASYATLGSLTRSYGPDPPELNVRWRNPGAPHVAPPSAERTKPVSLAPPPKKRPTWNVPMTVEPLANRSASTSAALWPV